MSRGDALARIALGCWTILLAGGCSSGANEATVLTVGPLISVEGAWTEVVASPGDSTAISRLLLESDGAWAAVRGEHAVYWLDANWRPSEAVILPEGADPRQLHRLPGGVAVATSRAVYVIRRGGDVPRVIPVPSLNFYVGLAVDAADRVYLPAISTSYFFDRVEGNSVGRWGLKPEGPHRPVEGEWLYGAAVHWATAGPEGIVVADVLGGEFLTYSDEGHATRRVRFPAPLDSAFKHRVYFRGDDRQATRFPPIRDIRTLADGRLLFVPGFGVRGFPGAGDAYLLEPGDTVLHPVRAIQLGSADYRDAEVRGDSLYVLRTDGSVRVHAMASTASGS